MGNLRTPVLSWVMVAVGLLIGCWGIRGASIPELARYTRGERGPAVGNIEADLPAALLSDLGLTVGYGLLLGGCALFFRSRASSHFSRRLATFVCGAVIVAVLADLLEGGLLWLTLQQEPDSAALLTATAAAMTIKWCAILLAAIGIPAALAIVARGAMAGARSAMLRKATPSRWKFPTTLDRTSHPVGATDQPAKLPPWWDVVLADPELPIPAAADEAVQKAVRQSPGQSLATLTEQQESWRRAYNVPGVKDVFEVRKSQPAQALCLSGGGVRSACVAMGAMQVLSDTPAQDPKNATNTSNLPTKWIDDFDYIISVSGGGYSAGARLLAVQPVPPDPAPPPTDPPQDAPPIVAALSERFEAGSAEFDHFRRGSSYIADSPAGLVRALAEVFKNLLFSLLTVFTVPVVVGWLIGWLLAKIAVAAFAPVPSTFTDEELLTHNDHFLSLLPNPAAYWAIGLFVVLAVVLTVVALIIEWGWSGQTSERARARTTMAGQAFMTFALVIFTITVALPALMRLCWWASSSSPPSTGGALAALSGVVGLNYVAALVAIVWKNKAKLVPDGTAGKSKSSRIKQALPRGMLQLLVIVATLTVLLLVWLALLGSFAAAIFHYNTQDGWGAHLLAVPHWQLWLAGLIGTVLFVGFADVTSMSLHPFYRRHLAGTFAVRRAGPPDAASSFERGAVAYPGSEPTWLATYGRTTEGGPKFVFAAAAAITGTDKPAPGLNATSYVMSADYVGGPELGWFKTQPLHVASPPRIRRDLTVQAAVAISGAAFASAMGRQNKGIEKLLAVSGARLGTWLPNPQFVRKLQMARSNTLTDPDDYARAWPTSLPTIRGAGYLYREIVGINSKDARLVQVTDGGHYDNSGLVEALRRRCRLIICFDGGGDTPPLASGLTDAIRLAKYELGVSIKLQSTGPYSVESIAPGSGKAFDEAHALASLNGRITRGTVVLGTIEYPVAAGLEKCTGILIYAKAVLAQCCPYWLLTYAAAKDSEVFPHDPTSDQWFNEAQFAAYTELGRIMAREVVQCQADLSADEADRTAAGGARAAEA